MAEIKYEGGELALFARARNWKRYFGARLGRHIRARVLEVGAGLGGTTAVLCDAGLDSWTALEPDPDLAERLEEMASAGVLPLAPEVVVGTLADLPGDRTFDTILYIDVLEHIEDDRGEVEQAVGHLSPEGKLVVLCPAHPALYTPFDQAIGHFRRYNKAMLRALTPPTARLVSSFYLDSVGMLLSLANRLLLKSAMPTARQIEVWDRIFVPFSRLMDPLLGWQVGKTVVAIWSRLR
jgi:SAM-dependent methyltransferase